MISHEHRCIFVHIPKCAGSSIEAVLWPGERTEEHLWMGFVDEFHNRHQTGGLQHLHADQIRTEVGDEVFGSYLRFSFVRNPFDRAVSQYAYLSRRPDLRRFLGMREDATFADYLDLLPSRLHVQWEPQTAFLVDPCTGVTLVDVVGRFETFEHDARALFDRLGVSVPAVPHVNAGVRGPYRGYYGRAERRALEDLYRQDLERFDYDF